MEYEDRITITTPEGLELELLLAGVGSRLIAALLDLLVRGALLVVVLIAAALIGSGLGAALAYVSSFALVFGYDVLFETRASGRTPGKRWAGLRVVCPSGRPVRLTTSAVRNLLRLVDILPGVYAVGLLFILFTERNQRLGDIAAGTVVVRERRAAQAVARSAAAAAGGAPVAYPGAPAAGYGAPAAGYGAPAAGYGAPAATPGSLARWDVSAISPQEIAAVRQFLARRSTLEPGSRAGLAQQLAAGLHDRDAGGPPGLDAEQFLESVAAAKARRG